MEEKNNIKGYIESFKDGFIRGWASITPDLSKPNICDLYIDNQFISYIEATTYREDLKDASVRSGIAGFLIPIPLFFCDNQEHIVILKTNNSDQIINSKKLKLSRIRNLVPVDENVFFDQTNTSFDSYKKVLFLAGFSHQSKLLNYQKHYVQTFQKAGFYVVYILAADAPENLAKVLCDADRVIIRRNFGYDFGSWATAIQLCQNEFVKAENIIIANDSIIGALGTIEQLLEKIENSSSDIWAITDSQDRKYHFQSYFWGLKKKSNQFQPVLDAFFLYRHPLPKDKQEAINHFEVQALSYFKCKGLSVDILFPEHDLIVLAEKAFIIGLQEHSEKWQVLFDLPLTERKKKRLNKGILKLARVLINHNATNPSHMYWNVLIDSGFPFVKRELLTLNPTNYPFPEQFRRAFEKNNQTELLDDLTNAYKSSKVI
jgi:hypothetical protein